MTEELKPCPFCGGEAACIEETAWQIGCHNGQCAAEPFVWEPSKEMAIAAWNTRAATPLDDPRVKALVGLLQRARQEMRLIRMKDSGAVYDVLLRTEIDATLSALGDRP